MAPPLGISPAYTLFQTGPPPSARRAGATLQQVVGAAALIACMS